MTRAARRPDLPLRRALAFGLPLLPLLAPRAAARGLAQGEPTGGKAPATGGLRTLVVLRHAEKDPAPAADPADPGLSKPGKARAESLTKLFGRAGIVRLYASEFRRTRETLEPLAAVLGIPVEILPATKSAEALEKLDALPSGSIGLIAGHSNTIPALLAAGGRALAGLEMTPNGPMLSEKDYGRIFVLTFGTPAADGRRSETALLELAYGE